MGFFLMMHESVISLIRKNSYDISLWFEKHLKKISPPLLTTITVRDSGAKISPFDFQLFPIGLNNLCKTDLKYIPTLIKGYFKQFEAGSKKIKKVMVLATAENSNPFYYEHLHVLEQLLKKSKLQVQIATLELIQKPITIQTPARKIIKIVPSFIEKQRIKADHFDPDFVYISHPFSSATHLHEIQQPIHPPLKVLSYKTKKSDYISICNRLVSDFAQILNTDPWFLKTEFQLEHQVNFDEKSGFEKVIRGIDTLLGLLQTKHQEHHITNDPSVRILSNNHAQGMGIISIHSSQELVSLYYQRKAKKTEGKSPSMINDVLIQEEIPESTLYKDIKGELIVYLIGGKVGGGYLRALGSTPSRNILSSREKLFPSICLTGNTHSHSKKRTDSKMNLLYSHVARIGSIASGYEIDKIPS